MIAIIDYGVGNIRAFANIYKKLNVTFKIAKTADDLSEATKLILPGVGAFDHAMSQLENSGMRQRIDELVLNNKLPVVGICVGMQMLAKSSDEGKLPGLGWIDASVKKFDESKINFRTGGYITGVIGILIFPWKLIADPNGYIFTWLIAYSSRGTVSWAFVR